VDLLAENRCLFLCRWKLHHDRKQRGGSKFGGVLYTACLAVVAGCCTRLPSALRWHRVSLLRRSCAGTIGRVEVPQDGSFLLDLKGMGEGRAGGSLHCFRTHLSALTQCRHAPVQLGESSKYESTRIVATAARAGQDETCRVRFWRGCCPRHSACLEHGCCIPILHNPCRHRV